MKEILLRVLPEAKEAPELGQGKWKYKEWLICIPCHFVSTGKLGAGLRVLKFQRGNPIDFERVLNIIK